MFKSLLQEFRQEMRDERREFQATIVSLIEAQNSRIDQISNGQTNGRASFSLSEVTSNITRVVQNTATLADKATRAVLVGAAEQDDPAETLRSDTLLLSSIIQKMNDESFTMESISFKRHPEERKGSSHRIIKIQFRNQSLRDAFLRRCQLIQGARMTGSPHAFFRRDYTSDELTLDREKRREAGMLNAECGELRWVVRDLRLFKLSNPRPLPPRSVHNLEKQREKGKADGINSTLASSLLSSNPSLNSQKSQFAVPRGRPSNRGRNGNSSSQSSLPRVTRSASRSAAESGTKRGADLSLDPSSSHKQQKLTCSPSSTIPVPLSVQNQSHPPIQH